VTLGRREIAGIALVAATVFLAFGLYVRRGHGEAVSMADWCAPGFEPIAGGGCFVLAQGASQEGLVVYLHGRYTPETANEEIDRQARVGRMAVARGFSVLAFRGKQGGCLGPELASYWCWPSNERTQDAGPEAVASWTAALDAAEARTGKGARYLLGFSNGGYFAALIATRALMAVDAVAIVGGGPVEPTRAWGSKPPLLLATADDDGALDSMLLLETELVREGWPHALIAREGGHALTDFEVDMALTFFTRTRREKLPLTPPLSTRRPQRDAALTSPPATPRDAGEPAIDED
jgi:dienelactone hydrolase